jgi:hypothetical protein
LARSLLTGWQRWAGQFLVVDRPSTPSYKGATQMRSGGMKNKIRASRQTLVGIVIPCTWDESDQVSEVSLSATDDEEYIIENSERFLDLVQQPIRAIGLVKSGKKMHRAINIKKFERLESLWMAE